MFRGRSGCSRLVVVSSADCMSPWKRQSFSRTSRSTSSITCESRQSCVACLATPSPSSYALVAGCAALKAKLIVVDLPGTKSATARRVRKPAVPKLLTL
jgi:hypothetical protein